MATAHCRRGSEQASERACRKKRWQRAYLSQPSQALRRQHLHAAARVLGGRPGFYLGAKQRGKKALWRARVEQRVEERAAAAPLLCAPRIRFGAAVRAQLAEQRARCYRRRRLGCAVRERGRHKAAPRR